MATKGGSRMRIPLSRIPKNFRCTLVYIWIYGTYWKAKKKYLAAKRKIGPLWEWLKDEDEGS